MTYLRTTMTQERLNNLMVLHVHKEPVDKLEIEKVAEEFISGREGRRRVFVTGFEKRGHFAHFPIFCFKTLISLEP